jgi:hypothetical protein
MNKLLYLLLIPFISLPSLAESFITVGHTQYLYSYPSKYKIFIDSLNDSDVEYIFFLGDSSLGDSDVFNNLNETVLNKIYSVPGNGEYLNGINYYLENVGYTNKAIESENLVFLLLDSNQPEDTIIELLKTWRQKFINVDKTVILLTHHRLWDDSIISASSYKHDKSYYFSSLYPFLSGFVDYLIAGNSKRQHFQDLTESLKNNKPPNVSLTFWEESFDDIKAYNIGMGNGFPYASYIQFDYINNHIIPMSKVIKVSNDHLDELGLVDMKKYSSVIRDQKITPLVRIFSIVYNKYKELIFGFILGLLISFLLVQFNKRKT